MPTEYIFLNENNECPKGTTVEFFTEKSEFNCTCAELVGYVIVVPWVVRLYAEIIHEL